MFFKKIGKRDSSKGVKSSAKAIDTAHVLYSGLGGHGSVVFSLLESNGELRTSSQLVFYGIEPLLEDYKSRCEKLEVPYIYIPLKKGNPLPAWLKLYVLLAKGSAKSIFLHNVTAILPVVLVASLSRKKLFVVEHMANALKTRFERFCSGYAMAYANRVIVLTEVYYYDLKELLKNKFRENKVLIIPNGIDTEKFNIRVKNHTGFILGMVSRFTPSKDHATLIYAFKEVYDKYPGTLLKLAGDGETMPDIIKLTDDLNLTNAVKFEGMLQEDELVRFFQSLDVYVHISKGETMSTAIMQAMSSGLPVLASDVNGINNMVTGEVGVLVENSVQDIASALESLAANPELRKEYGRNARAYAVKFFSSTNMSEKYLSLLR